MTTDSKTPSTPPARTGHAPASTPLALFGKFAVDARTLLSAGQIEGVATLGYN